MQPESAQPPPLEPPSRPGPEAHRPAAVQADDDWPVDPGRPLGLRLLALVGALAFVMLGLSSLAPLLQQPQPRPSTPSAATS